MKIFNLRDFVMKTLRGMKEHYAEFQVREYALNWYSKGVLIDEDMQEIDSWYIQPEPEPEPNEEIVENNEEIVENNEEVIE